MFGRLAAAAVALVVVVAGCDDGNPFGMVKVSGTATYEDGSPIPGEVVTVIFYPQTDPLDPKTHPRPAKAYVDKEGKFIEASTASWGDGVIAGPQKVMVQSMDANERPTGAVPREYTDADTTPLEMEVTHKNRVLEIKVPKP